jgi:hypothetical protein
MDKDNDKVIALVGAGLLAIGVFLPLVRVPKMGTMSFINSGSGYGLTVLVLAVAVIVLALLNLTKHVIWPGIVSAVLISLAFTGLQARLSEVRERATGDLGDNPFAGIAEAATSAIQLEYGWAVLAIGAILVIAAGGLAWRRRPGPPPAP